MNNKAEEMNNDKDDNTVTSPTGAASIDSDKTVETPNKSCQMTEEYETTTQAAIFINKDKFHCQEETSTTKIYLGFQSYQLWSMVRVPFYLILLLVPYICCIS